MSFDNTIDFKDHIVQYPNRFKQTTVAPGVVELVPTWITNSDEIIEPGTPVDSELFKKLKQNVTIYQQTFTTTENQTIINLNRDFLVGQNRVSLSIGGVRQYSGQDYTETDSHTLTMTTPQKGGLKAEVIMFTASQAIAEDFFEKTMAAIEATQAANTAAIRANDAYNATFFNFLAPVSTFSALATTYPNPKLYDAVMIDGLGDVNEGKIYRWEGSSWNYKKKASTGPMNDLETQFEYQNKALLGVKNSIFGGFCAHRGYQSIAPENTLKAIAKAGEMGFSMVELDPGVTVDGIWVLMHDQMVDRTTDGTGWLNQLTYAQTQTMKIDTPANLIDADEVIRIPLFEEAVKECAKWGLGINVDGSKFASTAQNFQYVYDTLNKYNLAEKSWIVIPTQAGRQLAKQTIPTMMVGWVTDISTIDADLAEAKQYSRAILGYASWALTDDVVYRCNRAGVEILAHSANDTLLAYQWINKGVNFVETDYVLPKGMV